MATIRLRHIVPSIGAVGALIAATVIVFAPSLHGGFIWDDHENIEHNAIVQAPDGLSRFWLTPENVDYWPLTSTTWWLEWRLWGDHTTGYHALNLILHIGGAVLLWRILARLGVAAPWVIAMAFAVHPANVESVAWITERKNTLSMFFAMLSIWLFLLSGAADGPTLTNTDAPSTRGRSPKRGQMDVGVSTSAHWPFLLASLVAFILSLLAKTAAVTLPGIFLLLIHWRRHRLTARDLFRLVPFALASTILAITTIWFQYHRAISAVAIRDDDVVSRLLIAGRALWFYFGTLLLPRHVSFEYARWPLPAHSPADALPLLLLIASFAAGLVLVRRGGKWFAPGLFAGLVYILLLLPVLGFFNIYFMRYALVSDHWQYIPSAAGLTLIIGSAAAGMNRLRVPHPIKVVLAVAYLIPLTYLARQQAYNYTDEKTLWLRTIEQNPSAWLAQSDLAASLTAEGDDAGAVPHWRAADEAHPHDSTILMGLGQSLAAAGQLAEGIGDLQAAIAAEPQSDAGYFQLGLAYLYAGHADEAVPQFDAALSRAENPAIRETIPPDRLAAEYAYAADARGVLMMMRHKPAEAVPFFRKAASLDPTSDEFRANLRGALAELRH